jgi:hypothetical protein
MYNVVYNTLYLMLVMYYCVEFIIKPYCIYVCYMNIMLYITFIIIRGLK